MIRDIIFACIVRKSVYFGNSILLKHVCAVMNASSLLLLHFGVIENLQKRPFELYSPLFIHIRKSFCKHPVPTRTKLQKFHLIFLIHCCDYHPKPYYHRRCGSISPIIFCVLLPIIHVDLWLSTEKEFKLVYIKYLNQWFVNNWVYSL